MFYFLFLLECRYHQSQKRNCFFLNNNLYHPVLGERSPFFTLFVNRCLPNDGWSRQPKHVVLNKNKYIASV
jgi:hypothetical protein